MPPEWLQFLSVAVAAAVGECCVEKDCRTMTLTISDWRMSGQDDFDHQRLENERSGLTLTISDWRRVVRIDFDHQRLEKSGQD